MNYTHMVVGVYNSLSKANSLLEKLGDKGYLAEQISIVTKDDITSGNVEIDNDTSEGVKSATKTGSIVGGVLGLLAGLGALTIPGVGALFISGPILAAAGITGLAGATASGAITGALAGGLVGFFKELGIDENIAANLEDKIKNGGILIGTSVKEENKDEVKDIYENHDADNVLVLELKKDE